MRQTARELTLYSGNRIYDARDTNFAWAGFVQVGRIGQIADTPATLNMIGSRPPWIEAHRARTPETFATFFPGPPPYGYDQSQGIAPFGTAWHDQGAALYNLEGRLQRKEWLDDYDVFAGLRMVLKSMESLIWLSPAPFNTTIWLQQDMVKVNPDRAPMGKRFYVFPENQNNNHWRLLIWDRANGQLWVFDSANNTSGKEERELANNINRWLTQREFKAEPVNRLHMRVISVAQPRQADQRDGWSCGIHCIENARQYFMEWNGRVSGENYPCWTRSILRPRTSMALAEAYVAMIRTELGNSGPIRSPPAPTLSMKEWMAICQHSTGGEEESNRRAWATWNHLKNQEVPSWVQTKVQTNLATFSMGNDFEGVADLTEYDLPDSSLPKDRQIVSKPVFELTPQPLRLNSPAVHTPGTPFTRKDTPTRSFLPDLRPSNPSPFRSADSPRISSQLFNVRIRDASTGRLRSSHSRNVSVGSLTESLDRMSVDSPSVQRSISTGRLLGHTGQKKEKKNLITGDIISAADQMRPTWDHRGLDFRIEPTYIAGFPGWKGPEGLWARMKDDQGAGKKAGNKQS